MPATGFFATNECLNQALAVENSIAKAKQTYTLQIMFTLKNASRRVVMLIGAVVLIIAGPLVAICVRWTQESRNRADAVRAVLESGAVVYFEEPTGLYSWVVEPFAGKELVGKEYARVATLVSVYDRPAFSALRHYGHALTDVTHVYVKGSHVGERELADIAKVPNITTLFFTRCSFGSIDARSSFAFAQLRNVRFDDCDNADGAVLAILKAPGLETLKVLHCDIGDSVIADGRSSSVTKLVFEGAEFKDGLPVDIRSRFPRLTRIVTDKNAFPELDAELWQQQSGVVLSRIL